MTTLQTTWGIHEVTLTWIPATNIPEKYIVSSAHGICFHEDRIAMVNLFESRGWDFPGGHMEVGETPNECFAREAMEEACIVGKSTVIGYILVDNRNDPNHDSSKYPDIGCQVYYRMDIDTILPFVQDFESSERDFFAVEEVPVKHDGWNAIHQAVLDTALASLS